MHSCVALVSKVPHNKKQPFDDEIVTFVPQGRTNASLSLLSQTYWRTYSPPTSSRSNMMQTWLKKWPKPSVRWIKNKRNYLWTHILTFNTGSSHWFSQVIRARVKDLMIPRYRIVTLVHIGQLAGQSMQISSRYLWDASNDTFTSYSIKNSSLFGMATVYAVYLEWIIKVNTFWFRSYMFLRFEPVSCKHTKYKNLSSRIHDVIY